MSKGMKWTIVIIVIIVLVGGYYFWKKSMTANDMMAPSQSAAAANSMATSTAPAAVSPSSKAGLTQSISTLNSQIQSNTTGIASLGTVPTEANINTAATQSKTVVGLMNALVPLMQSRVAAAGSASTVLQLKLTDMKQNIMSATAQIPNISASVKMSTSTLQQAKAQLVAAQKYIQTADTDAQTFVQALAN